MRINSKKISILIAILFLFLIYFFISMLGIFDKNTAQAISDNVENIELHKNQNPVNIEDILIQNTKDVVLEEMQTEEIDLEYTTIYTENNDLPSGTLHVVQCGIDGIQEIITIKKYVNDELKSEEIVASNIKRASINKIVEIGVRKRKK